MTIGVGGSTAEQQLANTHVWGTSPENPSFAAMATSLGLFGRVATTPDELADGMEALFAHDGPGLLELTSSKLQY